MRQQLYTLYDHVAETIIGSVMPFAREAAAIRAYNDLRKDQNTQLGQHPNDFLLLHVGEIDTSTGAILPKTAPEVVDTGASADGANDGAISSAPVDRGDPDINHVEANNASEWEKRYHEVMAARRNGR